MAFLALPFVRQGLAAEEPRADQFQAQFEELKTRLDNIDKQQKEIQSKDAQILEELERVRVWSRRR